MLSSSNGQHSESTIHIILLSHQMVQLILCSVYTCTIRALGQLYSGVVYSYGSCYCYLYILARPDRECVGVYAAMPMMSEVSK